MAKLTVDFEKEKPRPEVERWFRRPPYAYTTACPDPAWRPKKKEEQR